MTYYLLLFTYHFIEYYITTLNSNTTVVISEYENKLFESMTNKKPSDFRIEMQSVILTLVSELSSTISS